MTGSELREWMQAREISAEKLAGTLGVTERTVFRWRASAPPRFLPLALETVERRMRSKGK